MINASVETLRCSSQDSFDVVKLAFEVADVANNVVDDSFPLFRLGFELIDGLLTLFLVG